MTLRKLQKKIDLRYRRGSTCETLNCGWCEHYVKNHPVRHLGGEEVVGHEPRCRVMGLENSIRYRIRADHRCDAHQVAEWWERKCDEFWRERQGSIRDS